MNEEDEEDSKAIELPVPNSQPDIKLKKIQATVQTLSHSDGVCSDIYMDADSNTAKPSIKSGRVEAASDVEAVTENLRLHAEAKVCFAEQSNASDTNWSELNPVEPVVFTLDSHSTSDTRRKKKPL